jgi:predicted GIY-YIG superfamily endonuclease
MKTWIVYCHTHNESGRRYIGITSQTMEKRWNQHVSKAQYSKGGRWHFPNVIRKYGKDAFSHEVLGKNLTLKEANDLEKEYILKYDTRNPEKGFNTAEGGGSQPHPIRKNPWDDPEYRAKVSLAAKNRWKDPIIRAKNLAAIKAGLNTPESKAKRSVISKEVHSRPEVKAKLLIANKGRLNPKAREFMINLQNSLSPEERRIKSSRASKLNINRFKSKTIETKLKMSIAQKISQSRPEVKAKISAALKGRKFSDEHRAKLSAASSISSKGRIPSSETRAKLSVAMKISHSRPEVKAKISSAIKKLRSRRI